MQVSEEMFILALVAICFIGAVAILLVILAMRTINQRQNNPLSSPAPTSLVTPSSVNQSKRIANCTVAMSAGLAAVVFASRLVPIKENWIVATILLVSGVAAAFYAWFTFRSIK